MKETKYFKITAKGTKGKKGTIAQFWKQLTEFGGVKAEEIKPKVGGESCLK